MHDWICKNYRLRSGSTKLIIFLGLAILGQLRRSYSTTVVTIGERGHGKAQPTIHSIGKNATCMLRATKNICMRVRLLSYHSIVLSLAISKSELMAFSHGFDQKWRFKLSL